MYYYKAAEDLATQSGDTYHHGYALMRQAWLYHSQYDFDRAISLYRLALDTFKTPKDDKQTIQVLNAIAGLYITINIDSAQLFGEKAMQLSLSSDRYDLDYCSKILADIYFVKHDYKPCIEMAEEAITNTKDRQVYFHCHQLLAQAFAYLGSADSSRYYLMMSTPPTDKQDSVMLLTTQSVIAASNQENQKKLELQLLAGNIADTIVSEKSIHQLEQAAHDYQVSKMASQYEIKRTRALVVMLSLLLLLLACSIWIYRVSVRRRMELEHARTQLNAKLAELSKQTGENELQIKTVTLALSTVSYLGKRGASSFKDDKDLITANLPQEFWDDAELLTRKRLSKCLQSMAENGIELKKEEMRVLSLSLCGVPDVVIAKLMDYSSRRTVHNIKAAVAKKLDSSDGSLSDKLTKLINEA